MACIDMRIGFDYYKSVGDIQKLKDQVAEMNVKYFEETEIAKKSFWEDAFYQNIFFLMLTVQDAGKVKDIEKNDKKNPEIGKIFEKLYALTTEARELVDKIKEALGRDKGCFGSGGSLWLIGTPATEKRREDYIRKLKACFEDG